MRWRSTSAIKSCCVYRLSADLQKCGLAERKRSGAISRLVKLQRPPPEMRILAPGSFLCSSSSTRRPRLPAFIAHIRPAAPAPMITTSNDSIAESALCQTVRDSLEGFQEQHDENRISRGSYRFDAAAGLSQ